MNLLTPYTVTSQSSDVFIDAECHSTVAYGDIISTFKGRYVYVILEFNPSNTSSKSTNKVKNRLMALGI